MRIWRLFLLLVCLLTNLETALAVSNQQRDIVKSTISNNNHCATAFINVRDSYRLANSRPQRIISSNAEGPFSVAKAKRTSQRFILKQPHILLGIPHTPALELRATLFAHSGYYVIRLRRLLC